MQNSEIYRRGFVVPLSEDADTAIRNNDVEEDTPVDFYEIPDGEVFESLWGKGLFEKINSELGTMIDDYEETEIEFTQIPRISKTITEFKKTVEIDRKDSEVVSQLQRLCQVALNRSASLYFIL